MLAQTCASYRDTHCMVVCDRMCMNGKPHVHECEWKHMQTYTCTCMQTRILTHRHTHICSHMQMHASRNDMNTLTRTCSGTLQFSLNLCERSLLILSMVLYNQGINTGSSHHRLKRCRSKLKTRGEDPQEVGDPFKTS